MCGFIGKISKNQVDFNSLNKANSYNICRGPDSKKIENGNFSDIEGFSTTENYSFIFNRLSIIDLDEKAMQPMISNRYGTIALFNGEIFNHRELRSLLEKEKVHFRTNHSDSEVVLNGLSHYGINFVSKLIGQFSIVFYDSKINKLYMIRDRVGQKPLFFKSTNDDVSFSSNLKSLISLEKDNQIDFSQVINYLNFGVVPSPNTIFENIYKVEPGSIQEFNFGESKIKVSKNTYWNPEDYVDEKKFNNETFFDLFHDAVNVRLEADVPVSNFLSGGIDSSAIIKSMHDSGVECINTFSVINNESKYDESKWSSQVAQKYKTKHSTSEISQSISSELIQQSINILDEPYCDPSTVPSYLLSKQMSSSYKVAISGDGGDELLGGYQRVGQTLKNKSFSRNMYSKFYPFYPGIFGTGNKILSNSSDISISYPSYLEDRKLLKILKLNPTTSFKTNYINKDLKDYKNLILADYKFFLPEMMMLKIDRTSMASSLEVRSPFVDHRLIQYILSTQNSYFEINRPKSLLKDYLSKDFDSTFLNREKQGFVFNLEGWVYKNMNFISENLNNSDLINNIDRNILKKLSVNKSRINALRIWKLFVLDSYLNSIK